MALVQGIHFTSLRWVGSAADTQRTSYTLLLGSTSALAWQGNTTALILAAEKGHDAVIRTLLDRGANIAAVDRVRCVW